MNGDITGQVQLLRRAFDSLAITLSTAGCVDAAGVPVAAVLQTPVPIPAGRDRATFRIRTFSSANTVSAIACTVTANLGEEHASASFTVEPLRMTSFRVVPAAGIGPFTASATITLNARPAALRTVTLTSDNPAVGFGPAGGTQATASVPFNSGVALRTESVWAARVARVTAVRLTATLGAQTLASQVTIRAVP
ncbi:MAG: hypothetical protein IT480_01080 [Gammaproteobacteria bacterium]|nr:hypothetical protein [Gammaproteobacteria bacterium]